MRKGNLVSGRTAASVTAMRTVAAMVTVTATLLMATPAYAGVWKDDQHGTWYEREDGSYPKGGWAEINGKQFYFNEGGYLLRGTITPDGYQVDANGACVSRQSVAEITFTPDSVTTDLAINDYLYENPTSYYYHILEITNNSPDTIALTIQDTALAANGEPAKALTRLQVGNNTGTDFRVGTIEDGNVGAVTGSATETDIPSGCTVFARLLVTQAEEVTSFRTQIQTRLETEYQPAIQDVTLKLTQKSDCAVVKAYNQGNTAAEHVLATVLFLKDGKPVDCAQTYLIDRNQQLKPGATITKQVFTSREFDDCRVHVSGVRK